MIWRVEEFLLRDSEGGDGFGVVVFGEGRIGWEILEGGMGGNITIQRASLIEMVQCRRTPRFGLLLLVSLFSIFFLLCISIKI